MSKIELKPIECTNCGYTETPSPLNVEKFGLVRCPICGKSNFVEYDFVDETSKEKRIDDQAEVLYCVPRRGGEQIEELRLNIQYAVGGCSPYWSRLIAEKLFGLGYRKMPENMGEFSDGYHTFNELYHHRAVFFSVICNMFPEKAWKSKKHDTGDMYDGMFIVGIETEQGQATYHYDIEPYWDIFKVKELEYAPKYDGHTPSDAIERIGNLPCEDYRKQSEGGVAESNEPQRMFQLRL